MVKIIVTYSVIMLFLLLKQQSSKMLVLVQLLTIPCHKRYQLGGCYYGTNYQFSLFPYQ